MYFLKSSHVEYSFFLILHTARHLILQFPGNLFLIKAFNRLSRHVIWDFWDETNTFLSDYPPSWKPNRNIYFIIDIQIRMTSRRHLSSLSKQRSSQSRKKMLQNYSRNRFKPWKAHELAHSCGKADLKLIYSYWANIHQQVINWPCKSLHKS